MKKVLIYINILLVLTTLFALLARTIDPNDFWPVAFLGLLFPYLIIANILFICLWAIYHVQYVWGSIILLIICWNAIGGYLQFNFPEKGDHPGTIDVMSYNINNGINSYNKTRSKRKKEKDNQLKTYFSSLDRVPDILLLQEVGPIAKNILNESFPKHKSHQIDKRGTAIYSIYPILQSGEIDFGTNVNSCMWADLLIYDDTLRVYSVHLKSNEITSATAKIVKEGNIQDEKTWSSIKWILSKYKDNNQTRSGQVQLIKEHIKKSPHPVILGSDLNDPPQSFTYAQLTEVLSDSYRSKGLGLGTSFGGQIPLLRIDYIMVSSEISILDQKVEKFKFSDHFPITASLLLN